MNKLSCTFYRLVIYLQYAQELRSGALPHKHSIGAQKNERIVIQIRCPRCFPNEANLRLTSVHGNPNSQNRHGVSPRDQFYRQPQDGEEQSVGGSSFE